MNVKYRVTLDTSERAQLASLVLGKGAFRRLKRAQILLAADTGSTDEEIAKNVAVGILASVRGWRSPARLASNKPLQPHSAMCVAWEGPSPQLTYSA